MFTVSKLLMSGIGQVPSPRRATLGVWAWASAFRATIPRRAISIGLGQFQHLSLQLFNH